MPVRWKTWCVLLAAALLLIGTACAEEPTQYALLAEETGLDTANLCAWLEIPGAGLTLPVMQHPDDPAFYLSHDAAGQESDGGALYTEKDYNSKDFSDPAVVIYGMRRNDGSMFGSLQEWYSGAFAQHADILLHLPDGTRSYTAFAAVPYSSIHLLYYNDFHFAQVYTRFIEDVFSVRRVGVQLDESQKPQAGERLLILSTSLRGDASQRYLVIAKENKTETK